MTRDAEHAPPRYAPDTRPQTRGSATVHERHRRQPTHGVGPLEISFVRALFALVLISTVTLWMAELTFGVVNPLLPLITTLACGYSYLRLVRGKRPILGRILGNLIAVGSLLLVLNAFVVFQNPSVAAIGSLLNVLLWVKLLQEKKNRDFVQILLLSVSQMVVAAVLTQALWFGAAAALYLLIATWTLLLFHFKREGDGDYHPLKKRQVDWRQFRTHELISRAFVGMMLLTLLLTTLGTVLVFVSIPRVTTDWLSEVMPMEDRSRTGLSDQVRLGGGGRIDKDYRVALYVEFGEKPEFDLLYRAVVQTHYDPAFRAWWTAPQTYEPVDPAVIPGTDYLSADAVVASFTDNQSPRMVRMLPLPGELYYSGDTGRHTSNPDAPYSVVLEEPRSDRLQFASTLGMVETEELWRRQTVRYRAVTRRPRPVEEVLDKPLMRTRNEETGEVETNAHLRMIGYEYDAHPLRAWRDENDEMLREWLREEVPALVGEDDTPSESWTLRDAHRIMRVLNEEPYFYTTQRRAPPEGMDPTLYFLRESKGGHCEYYASALAMLLLSEGYRARVITGYAGGDEWIESDRGKPVNVVLNAHAHAWVEVQLETGEWRILNPSPSVGAEPEPLSAWELWLAGLQYRWRRHVVDFDLAQQLGILEWLERQLEALRGGLSSLGEHSLTLLDRLVPETWTDGAKVAAGVAFSATPVVLVGLAWAKLRKRRRRGGTHSKAARRSAFRPMHELLHLLERGRIRRTPSATPREFLARDELEALLTQPERELFLRCYHAARFGERTPSPEEMRRMRDILARVRESLREGGHRQGPATDGTHGEPPEPRASAVAG